MRGPHTPGVTAGMRGPHARAGDRGERAEPHTPAGDRGKPAGLSEMIVGLLKQRPMDSRQIRDLTQETQEYIVDALRELLEERRIAIQPNNQYTLI